MPRLVVHEHSREGGVHYDLMLESPGLLWTWRFAELPGSESEQLCERIQDHDRKFLEYEGALSPGNGSVRIIDSGSFDLLAAGEDEVHFTARGQRLTGACRLMRRGENAWALQCDPVA